MDEGTNVLKVHIYFTDSKMTSNACQFQAVLYTMHMDYLTKH